MTDQVQVDARQGPPNQALRRLRVLLVDDQPMIGEAVRRMLLPEKEVDFCYCSDPTQAMAMAAEFNPTVILQDLVMPEVDGLTMLRFYRSNPATKDVPIIVLSTKEEPKVKAEAFALGAHDYLVKLPDPIELTARIRHHSQGYIAQIERNAAYAALKESQERLAEELAEAAKYVISLLPDRMSGEIKTDWMFIPSVELGGDAFGYHWLDEDHFAIYLLDVCGHGVKAALLSISAINVLRNQALAATDFRSPTEVLSSLNKVFQMERHHDMYFTMWYGVFDKRKRQLTYANGGHPPPVLMAGTSETSATAVELSQRGLIIGAFPEMPYQSQTIDLPEFGCLYLFSDGLYEVTRPDATMLTYPEFLEILTGAKGTAQAAIERTISSIRQVRGGDQFEDDVSILEVRF